MAGDAVGLEKEDNSKAKGGDGSRRSMWFGGRRMLRYNLESSSNVSSIAILAIEPVELCFNTNLTISTLYAPSICQYSRELTYGQTITAPTPSPTIDWLWNNDGYPPDNLVTDTPTGSPVGWTHDGWNDDGFKPIKPPASPKCISKSSQIVSFVLKVPSGIL